MTSESDTPNADLMFDVGHLSFPIRLELANLILTWIWRSRGYVTPDDIDRVVDDWTTTRPDRNPQDRARLFDSLTPHARRG